MFMRVKCFSKIITKRKNLNKFQFSDIVSQLFKEPLELETILMKIKLPISDSWIPAAINTLKKP